MAISNYSILVVLSGLTTPPARAGLTIAPAELKVALAELTVVGA